MDVLSTFPFNIFRAYDIRGNLAIFTSDVVTAIAHALAKHYQSQAQTDIVLGYDARLSSPLYAAIVADIFYQYGLSVIALGCCSSPMMYFMASRYAQGNGVMITASHNPKSDNGIKWIVKGKPPTPKQIEKIGTIAVNHYDLSIERPSPTNFSHQIKSNHCLIYQQALTEDIRLLRPFKVVLDGLHGSAGYCAKEILNQLGCEVIPLRCQANGHFPDHAPDPSKSAHLKKIAESIVEHKADIGIALDGDGDRVVLLDEQARIITPDYLIALFSKICLQTHPQAEIVYDVKCSNIIPQMVQSLGGRPKMIRTGSSFLRKYLAQSKGNAVFGGEYAGHYVFNDGRGYGYDDGLYAALRLLEYLSQFSNRSVSQLFLDFPERYCTEDAYISTYLSEPKKVLQEVENLGHKFSAKISKVDGVRFDFDDGFGIIRTSNTGEYFTVRFDAGTPLQLADIRHRFAHILANKYPKIAQDISNIN